MKALAAALIIFFVILFFMYTQKPQSRNSVVQEQWDRSDFQAVDPTIIQNTITQIQENAPTLYPVNTVYFNQTGSGYEGRLMFMDSANYAGVQYDVTVDESGKLTTANKGIPADYMNPFTGFVNKFKFGNLNTSDPTPDMQAVWNNYLVTA